MNISLNWLKQYLDISGYTPDELASVGTIAGVEVENIAYLAKASKLVIGEVVECVNHPESDHLHILKVNIGDEVTQIVCGAPNARKGLKVIVALPGCKLPAKGIDIKKGVIRGQESNGMCCSLVELGVDEKYLKQEQIDGIEELPLDAPVGETNVLKYLGLDDVIFELKPTPNRGDVLSLLSYAYELGAVLDREVKFDYNVELPTLSKSSYTVSSDTEKCPNFSIRGVKGIKVCESPKWLKDALHSSGIRSINNVVDIGNYVMLLTGLPLHMYDADKLASNNFVVRDDYEGTFVALDDQEYPLSKGDLVVTNNNEVSCLGGVMGGKSTMVEDTTVNLAIESALFDGVQIRKTSRRVMLTSDSSTRFVRGIDESRSKLALDLAASLLVSLADAKEVEEIVTYGDISNKAKQISTTVERINTLLGTTFTKEEVVSVFNRLSFEVLEEGNTLLVTPTSYRKDVVIEEDLVEEVIRILGFDRLPMTYPLTATTGKLSEEQAKRRKIRNHLLENGINEALTYSLVERKIVDDFNVFAHNEGKETTDLLMPMTEEKAVLRKSVVPSLLQSVAYNNARKMEDVSFYEITNVYPKGECKEHLGIVLSGKLRNVKWMHNTTTDFYTLKGLVISLFNLLGVEPNRYTLTRVEENNKFYHPGRSAYIMVGKKKIGVLGQIHPKMEKKYDVKTVYIAELDLGEILAIKTSKARFAQIPVYPAIKRDIALVVNETVAGADLLKCIKKAGKSLVNNCEIFDIYQGEHVEKGYKSIAISITYQDVTKTMVDQEINAVHSAVLSALEKEYNAKLRQ